MINIENINVKKIKDIHNYCYKLIKLHYDVANIFNDYKIFIYKKHVYYGIDSNNKRFISDKLSYYTLDKFEMLFNSVYKMYNHPRPDYYVVLYNRMPYINIISRKKN